MPRGPAENRPPVRCPCRKGHWVCLAIVVGLWSTVAPGLGAAGPTVLARQPAIGQPPEGGPPADLEAMPAAEWQAGGPYLRPVLIRVDGPIGWAQFRYVDRALRRAIEIDADLILLHINGPGGLLEESLQLADALQSISSARVSGFISQEAISGHAIMSLGCQDLFMTGGALIGDAGPIAIAPGGPFEHAPEKILSRLSSRMRELAEAGQRPAGLAEAMVDRSVEVFQVRDRQQDQLRLMTAAEMQAEGPESRWELIGLVLESRTGSFLTVTGRRAAQLGLIQGLAADESAWWDMYGVKQPLLSIERSWIDDLAFVLSLRVVVFLLVTVGLIALYFELISPGIGLGGLVALACFGLYFWAQWLGGAAGWLDVLLFVLGVIFLLTELYVLPGFGIAGLAGFFMLIGSLVMASSRRVGWGEPASQAWFPNIDALLTILGAMTLAAVLLIWGSRYLRGRPLLSRLILQPPKRSPPAAGSLAAQPPGGTSVAAGLEAKSLTAAGVAASSDAELARPAATQTDSEPHNLLGAPGVTSGPLAPSGRALFGDQLLDVVSEADFIDDATAVVIIGRQGRNWVVRPSP
jgi:membrane-bound serine protease (ClpP class)